MVGVVLVDFHFTKEERSLSIFLLQLLYTESPATHGGGWKREDDLLEGDTGPKGQKRPGLTRSVLYRACPRPYPCHTQCHVWVNFGNNTTRIMDVLQPANLELSLLALDNVLNQEDEVEMHWKLSLERAQYEVDRAQRQYDLAEPENRLVVRSLEARWNEKMAALNNLRQDYDRYRVSRAWRPY